MSLQFLSAPAFWLGLVGLAATLFALQRLRVRHREVVVPTLLFWNEAVEEAPARVLVERFRHPLAYLLSLLLAATLWLTLAGPRAAASTDAPAVTVVIDTSADAGRTERLGAALAAAERIVPTLPAARRRVIASGADARTLLAPGEPFALLASRTRALAADTSPPSVERTLEGVAAREGEQVVVVLGDRRVEPAAGAARVIQPPLEGLDSRRANAGVVALGIAAAASGNPAAVDALVAVVGDVLPELRLDGRAISLRALRAESDGSRAFVATDLPTEGGLLSAALPEGDALDVDDRAQRRLPVRGAIPVWFDPALPEPFAVALAADPGLRLVADPGTARVAVRAEETGAADGLPGLVLSSAETQAEPVLLTHAAEADPYAVLRAVVPRLGLDRVDAAALAEAAGVPFAVGAGPGPLRTVALWRELLDPEGANLGASRAFPVLVARSIRWLAESEALVPEVRVGDPLRVTEPLASTEGTAALPPFGAGPRPARAGSVRDGAGVEHPVALLSRASSAPALVDAGEDAGAAEEALEELADPDVDWAARLLFFALFLLGLEWVLVRTGRMP